ncbi:MAG: hypothetical protein V1859_09365 [archaeon]
MPTNKELKLLQELLAVINKYDKKTIQLVLDNNDNPTLNSIVRKISNRIESKKTKRGTNTNKYLTVPYGIRSLREKDANKYHLLLEFYDELVTKKVLPTNKEIHEFSMNLNTKIYQSSSRVVTILRLINKIKYLDYELLNKEINKLKKYNSNDRSLAGWTNYILKDETEK